MDFSELREATKADMVACGFYDGGVQYDVGLPAYIGKNGTATVVVGHADDYWFAEAYDASGGTIDTWMGESPQEAFDRLVADNDVLW